MRKLRARLRHCGPQTRYPDQTQDQTQDQSHGESSPGGDSGSGQPGRGGSPQAGGRRPHRDEGMNTAEYAVGTLAAVAFAGLLLKVLTSDAVRNALASIVQRALQ
jgi:hypothetical protein